MREFCQYECPRRVNTHETSARASRVIRFVTSLSSERLGASLTNKSQKVNAEGNNNECESNELLLPSIADVGFRRTTEVVRLFLRDVNAANNNQQGSGWMREKDSNQQGGG